MCQQPRKNTGHKSVLFVIYLDHKFADFSLPKTAKEDDSLFMAFSQEYRESRDYYNSLT